VFDTWKLKGITVGEWRRLTRRRLDETQKFMAWHMGISRVKYIEWELDSDPFVPWDGDEITVNEILFLHRHRSGKTQDEVGKAIDRSSYWVREMEADRQDWKLLQDYWEGLSN